MFFMSYFIKSSWSINTNIAVVFADLVKCFSHQNRSTVDLYLCMVCELWPVQVKIKNNKGKKQLCEGYNITMLQYISYLTLCIADMPLPLV